MTAAITTLRSTLATDLTNAGVWSVFAFPPATLLANACVITPADPYLTPSNNDYITISPMANFKILITKPALDNQGNLAGMEEYILALVTHKLIYRCNAFLFALLQIHKKNFQ